MTPSYSRVTNMLFWSLLLGSLLAILVFEFGPERRLDILSQASLAARAQDATVQLVNPAGLSHLEGRHLTLGGQLLYGDVPYDLDDPAEGDVDTVIGWFPAASAYYSQQLDDRWSAGLALYGNFGLGLDFGDWADKQLIKKATLIGLTLQPSIAYRLDEHWSLGAGIGINYGLFSLTGRAMAGSRSRTTETGPSMPSWGCSMSGTREAASGWAMPAR